MMVRSFKREKSFTSVDGFDFSVSSVFRLTFGGTPCRAVALPCEYQIRLAENREDAE